MSIPSEPKASATSAAPDSGTVSTHGAQVERPAWASTDEMMRNYFDNEWGVAEIGRAHV